MSDAKNDTGSAPSETPEPAAPAVTADSTAPDTVPARTSDAPERVGDSSGRPDAPRTKPPKGVDAKGKVASSKAGAWWTGMILAAALSIVFLIFIAQNAQAVPIRFLSWEANVSQAVALLLALAVGVLIVAIPGMVRIIQLRRALAKNAKAANRAARRSA